MDGQVAPAKLIVSNISARRRAPIVKASRSTVLSRRRHRVDGRFDGEIGSVDGNRRRGFDGGMVAVLPGRPGDTVHGRWMVTMHPQNVFISNESSVSSRRRHWVDGEDVGLSSAAVGDDGGMATVSPGRPGDTMVDGR